MPQLIQRSPIGLLSLLDSKAGGVAPNMLLDEVRGVVDLIDLLGHQQRFAFTEEQTPAGPGNFFFPTMSVPPGEIWRVLSLGLRINRTLGAPSGQVVYLAPATSGVLQAAYGLGNTVSAVNVANSVGMGGWDGEMWWTPGYTAGYNSRDFVAATTEGTYRLSILAERYTL